MSEDIKGVFVRLPLSEEQRELMVDAASWGQPDDSHDKAIIAIGTPIQPCADVESVTGPDDWCPLVRRTDMEAQVARVAAEKDAAIGRLKEVLALFTEYEKLMDSGEDVAGMMAYADLQKQVRAALNEGSTE